MKDRKFIVNVRFKISGEIPEYVTEEHIKSNIEDNINRDVYLHGEYYNEDQEWLLGGDADVDIELKEYSVVYDESPFCEHCGKNHKDFAATISIGGISFCTTCANYDDDFDDKEIKEIEKIEKKELKKYYKKKLKELE